MLAIGITAAPRKENYLNESLLSLRKAGFKQPVHLFKEPGHYHKLVDKDVIEHQNKKILGCFPNFKSGLDYLLKETEADWILMLQDDVIWRTDASSILEDSMKRYQYDRELGMLSPYTSPSMVKGVTDFVPDEGWYPAKFYNKAFWGACAMLFPRPAAKAMASHSRYLNHKHPRKLDVVVGNVLRRELNLKIYVRTPSLANHIGSVSTLGRHKIKGNAWGRKGFRFREKP